MNRIEMSVGTKRRNREREKIQTEGTKESKNGLANYFLSATLQTGDPL